MYMVLSLHIRAQYNCEYVHTLIQFGVHNIDIPLQMLLHELD